MLEKGVLEFKVDSNDVNCSINRENGKRSSANNQSGEVEVVGKVSRWIS